jgi:hypothetical protein
MLPVNVHTAVTTAVARFVHNDAPHDGHRERRLTAAHSILAVVSRAPSRRSRSLLNRCNPPWSRDKVPLGTSMTTDYISTLRHLCCVGWTTQLRTASTFCTSEKRSVLHIVPSHEAAIFRTQAQLCRKCQQVVRSIGYAGGASNCSCRAGSLAIYVLGTFQKRHM